MKLSTSLILCLVVSFLMSDIYAQSFNTGSIGVTQTSGGRTRIFSVGTTRQIDRTSILVGVSSSQVFDYNQDQDAIESAVTVATPTLSDYEVTAALNNLYSNLPPNVEARLNIYGWTNGAYLLVKVRVTNKEAAAINAIFGLEVIPQVENTYGGEVIQWDAPSQSVLINKSMWVGYKIFSSPITALKSIQWVTGYGTDALYYQWLTQGTFDAPLTAAVDGSVAIFGVAPLNINTGETKDYYYGVALGTDKATCLTNLSFAEMRYNNLVPVELTSFTASVNGTNVRLAWATATEVNNRGFEIERSINNIEWSLIGFKEGAGTISEVQNYLFTDNLAGITAQKIYYRLKQIDFDGTSSYSDAVEVENRMAPDQFVLEQNYPNPFNPSTKISFGLPEKSNVMLKVFNLIGEEVALVTSGVYEAGTYSFNFDASELPTGIYMYVLQTENNVISRKMTLLK